MPSQSAPGHALGDGQWERAFQCTSVGSEVLGVWAVWPYTTCQRTTDSDSISVSTTFVCHQTTQRERERERGTTYTYALCS